MIKKLLLLLVVVFLRDDALAEEELELREATKQRVIGAEILGLYLRSLGSRSCGSRLLAIHGLSELLTQLQTEPHLQTCSTDTTFVTSSIAQSLETLHLFVADTRFTGSKALCRDVCHASDTLARSLIVVGTCDTHIRQLNTQLVEDG